MSRPKEVPGALPRWSELLKEIRKLCGEDTSIAFTAAELAGKITFVVAGQDTTPAQHASAWMSKFVRWGYLKRSGSVKTAGRPATRYSITDKGVKWEPEEGPRAAYLRLLEAGEALLTAKTARQDTEARLALEAACKACRKREDEYKKRLAKN